MSDQTDYNQLNYIEQRVKSDGKNPIIAWLLWFFLGTLGGHRFYLGQPKAVVMLIITLLSYVLLFVFFIGAIGLLAMLVWWLIDATKIGLLD